MKLRELIAKLQDIEARQGGEVIVDVGLNHDEDGFCSKTIEAIDDVNFEAVVMLHGGNIQPAEGVSLPPARALAHEVLQERYRQLHEEDWTPEHDDGHRRGELARAAAAYALSATGQYEGSGVPVAWPWRGSFWKPSTPRRDLVKAAALILAEIERLDRLDARAEVPA
ncbi:hypothetical protein [Deinococcus yunweiensis]|uniref:hypothetical protein n=1 Tax=Deinococcus yunweiensis TaxID=367282 RepID=UPI00398E8841